MIWSAITFRSPVTVIDRIRSPPTGVMTAPPPAGGWRTRRPACPGSGRLDLDEAAADGAVPGGAEEVALLLRAVVVVDAEGAAAVGRQHRLPRLPLGEAVPVAAEDGAQVKPLEALQHGVGVARPVGHLGA